MFGAVKKNESITLPKLGRQFNLQQGVDAISWVDALVSGRYVKHTSGFVYVDMSDDAYTTSLLAKAYPSSTFYVANVSQEFQLKNVFQLQDVPDNSVNYLYLGHTLSFASEAERIRLFQFVDAKLAPGGYVVVPYEAKVGWSEYRVVLDLLKELTGHTKDPITSDWLDKVFYHLNDLGAKKVNALKNKDFLNKLLMYLKSLSDEHVIKVLNGEAFYTFYPFDVHRSLNTQASGAFRYVGTLPVFRNYLKLGLDSNQKDFLGDLKDLLMAAQRYDLIATPFFRMDIWQKSYAVGSLDEGTTSDFYFGCVSHFDQFASKIQRGFMTLNFVDQVFNEIRKHLNKDFYTLPEIIQHVGHLARSPQEIVDRLMLLVMGDQVRYALNKPYTSESAITTKPAKLHFCFSDNREMFSDIRRFWNEGGVVVEPVSGLLIPFDQKMSMLISALTKVHEAMAPQYCVDVVSEYLQDLPDKGIIHKQFKSLLIFFKRHYLVKFLELGLVDRVLVE